MSIYWMLWMANTICAVQYENLTKYTKIPKKQQHMPMSMQIQMNWSNKFCEYFFLECWKGLEEVALGHEYSTTLKWILIHANVYVFKSKCEKRIVGTKRNGRYYVILCSNKVKPKETTCWFVFSKKNRNTNVTFMQNMLTANVSWTMNTFIDEHAQFISRCLFPNLFYCSLLFFFLVSYNDLMLVLASFHSSNIKDLELFVLALKTLKTQFVANLPFWQN